MGKEKQRKKVKKYPKMNTMQTIITIIVEIFLLKSHFRLEMKIKKIISYLTKIDNKI